MKLGGRDDVIVLRDPPPTYVLGIRLVSRRRYMAKFAALRLARLVCVLGVRLAIALSIRILSALGQMVRIGRGVPAAILGAQ
jgi:hypothetical protein